MEQKQLELTSLTHLSGAKKYQGWLDDLKIIGDELSMQQFKEGLSLDNAIEFQLDYIGKIVGYPRPIRFGNNEAVYDQSFYDNANWAGDDANLIYIDDETYRKILKAWCAQLTEPTTLNNIYKLLAEIFGADVPFRIIADNREILLQVPSSLSDINKSIILQGIIYPPQNTTVTYQIVT